MANEGWIPDVLGLRSRISIYPVSATGNIDDLALPAGTTHVVFTGSGAKTWRGMVPTNTEITFYNAATGDLTISHEAGSSSANQFSHFGATDLVCAPGSGGKTFYGGVSATKWTVMTGGAATPAPDPTFTGLTGFGASDVITTASPGGIAGTSGGFYVYWIFSRSALLSSGAHPFSRMNAAFNQGWAIAQTTATAFAFCAISGGGAFIQSPAWTQGAGDVNEICALVGVHTGTALKLYANGALVGSSTAITGYTAYSGPTQIGDTATGGAPTEFTSFCAGGGDGVPSDSDVVAWFAALKSSSDLNTAMPNVAQQHIWPTDNTTSIVDGPGTDNMTITGTLSTSVMDPIAWGW